MSVPNYRGYVLTLIAIYAVLWSALATAPFDRHDWLLENVLVLLFGVGMFALHKQFVFSRISYTLIFVFMCLHAVGSHYTYAEVPYEQAWRALTGRSFNAMLGWERNNFDRLVHFSYGLLLAYPLREIFLRVADARGFWGYFLPLDFTLSTSALYELIEWAAAEFFGGDLGVAYLGTQGDVWDAQKDMGCAGTGALIAMLITAALNFWLQRDFAREWSESLRIKVNRPLGENEIARMLGERRERVD
jgi:putative membrane protein